MIFRIGILVAVAVAFSGTLARAQVPDLDRMDIVLKSVPDGPVAKVFGANIGKEKFVQFYLGELKRIRSSMGGGELEPGMRVEVGLWCLRKLVEQEILYQEGLRQPIKIDEAEVESAWSAQLAGLRSSFNVALPGEMTEAEVLGRIGLASRDEALADVRRALIIIEMRRRITGENDIEVDEDRIEKAYESAKQRISHPGKMHLRQIFIRAEPGDTPEAQRQREDARKRAESALARVFAGQSFGSIASSMSEAPDRDSRGDLGLVPLDEIPDFMVETALELEVGDVSDVFESEFGFHIVELVAFEEGKQPTLEEAAPFIREQLTAREGESAVRKYCSSVIEKADDVQVFLELEKNLSIHSE